MSFDEVLDQVRALLQQRGRVTYGALKRRFTLDDEYLEDLKGELIRAEGVAADEGGDVLVWVGNSEEDKGKRITDKGGKGENSLASRVQSLESEGKEQAPSSQTLDPRLSDSRLTAAERRQLTVMFCDLVDSTTLSTLLDPEELREVVHAYHQTCAEVISRYGGHTAQHLGDGLLVYFGYPAAHEDDAQRAVRTGLEILTGLQSLNAGLQPAIRSRLPYPLQVRIGIHTGLVVVGEIGGGEKREHLALGETPNIAARIQGQANPDEVVISAATYRLVEGLFEGEDRGQPALKGVTAPLTLYRIFQESAVHSRFEAVLQKGLTPLVGREEELILLRQRWEQAKEGEGQVVLLSGEAGIGKSRLVQELKNAVSREGAIRIEFRCSPYHQNSAFYPILDHLQRLLQFAPEDTPQSKLAKLQQALAQYRFPRAETLALLTALLSLPQPDGLPPLTLSPQKQKEKTQETLVAWVIEETERQVVYLVWEDLHWIDPSSLELLTLVLQQVPTSRALVVLTYRPDFTPPWRARAHSTQLTLNRLGQRHVMAMVNQVTAKALLSTEVVQQIVSKTDGVPLFVEELTKSVVEAVGAHGRVPLQTIAIPATLQDSLMARLDRLGVAKDIAQLGATLGREFSYELLHAVSPREEIQLQHALGQLVDAELLYQHGLPPQAHYLFKHALIQDTAYQSLLKSTRRQYHSQIAQVLETQFSETVETQPELVAHHYTEAGLVEQAIPYWQQAGRRAAQRSANVEAVSHLRRGLALVEMLPETPERNQHELAVQATLGPVLIQTQGWGAQETGAAYTRAAELCQQLGETAERFPVLCGMWGFQVVRADYQTARKLGEQLLHLAEREHDPALLVEAHWTLGCTLFFMTELEAARWHFERGVAHYDALQHRALAIEYGHDPAMSSLCFEAQALWLLGYPEQALRQSQASVTLARGLAHPFSLAFALNWAANLHQHRREWDQTQEQAEAAIALATEQGFPYWVAQSTIYRGRAVVEHGQATAGIEQMRGGIAALRDTGAEIFQSYFLCMLAEAYLHDGQVEEGLATVAEALAFVDRTEERFYEAELWRIKGELTLAQSSVSSRVGNAHQSVSNAEAITVGCAHPTEESEAEACFLKATDIARTQQAKSLELRAAMSLVRLRQQQAMQDASRTTHHETRAKLDEAHNMLSEIYNWFTEGFDTKDLQEAKALLETLGQTGEGS